MGYGTGCWGRVRCSNVEAGFRARAARRSVKSHAPSAGRPGASEADAMTCGPDNVGLARAKTRLTWKTARGGRGSAALLSRGCDDHAGQVRRGDKVWRQRRLGRNIVRRLAQDGRSLFGLLGRLAVRFTHGLGRWTGVSESCGCPPTLDLPPPTTAPPKALRRLGWPRSIPMHLPNRAGWRR